MTCAQNEPPEHGSAYLIGEGLVMPWLTSARMRPISPTAEAPSYQLGVVAHLVVLVIDGGRVVVEQNAPEIGIVASADAGVAHHHGRHVVSRAFAAAGLHRVDDGILCECQLGLPTSIAPC